MSLKEFLLHKMRMSHIYQPVMIKALLMRNGMATQTDIAKEILSYDQSQLEYYEKITNNMVGRILRNHNIVKKEGKNYSLIDFKSLNCSEISELIEICDKKINEYILARGERIFQHRSKNRKPVPGSIRYKVLKRARGRCELCGISMEEKALEVDHITPKNLGGEDSINNYQALCYTCNSNKGDRDDMDFREIQKTYSVRQDDCVFCSIYSRVIAANNLAHAFKDKYPVSTGHTLIIPKRHCLDYFDLTQPEINAIHQLIHQVKEKLISEDSSITGFNIGINSGADAGQTIFHCHFHLIPRRSGDIENPIGGVRNIFPGKGKY